MGKITIKNQSEPTTPVSGNAELYLDIADGHLKQKAADGTVYDLTRQNIDQNLNMNNFKIINLATPTANTDAANKSYVDNSLDGLHWKDPARVATTANITLSGTQTIDGVSVVIGDRVLVKDQTTQTQNGIYVVASGAWTLASDANIGSELEGSAIGVREGTTNATTEFVNSNIGDITLGTTNITFVERVSTTTPTNLTSSLTSTTVAINSSTGADVVINSATNTNAGVMSASDKDKLDKLIDDNVAVTLNARNSTGTRNFASGDLVFNLGSGVFSNGVDVDNFKADLVDLEIPMGILNQAVNADTTVEGAIVRVGAVQITQTGLSHSNGANTELFLERYLHSSIPSNQYRWRFTTTSSDDTYFIGHLVFRQSSPADTYWAFVDFGYLHTDRESIDTAAFTANQLTLTKRDETTKTTTMPLATTSANGAMSSADKTKLDEINLVSNVQDRVTTLPASPTTGDRVIFLGVGSNQNKIAEYNGTSWDYTTPSEGWLVYVEDEDRHYKYVTSWVTIVSGEPVDFPFTFRTSRFLGPIVYAEMARVVIDNSNFEVTGCTIMSQSFGAGSLFFRAQSVGGTTIYNSTTITSSVAGGIYEMGTFTNIPSSSTSKLGIQLLGAFNNSSPAMFGFTLHGRYR